MKKHLFYLRLLLATTLCWSMGPGVNAQVFCAGNRFDNGDFEIGTPTLSDQDINLAQGWHAIWGSGSLADFYPFNFAPAGFTPPCPPSGNYATFWVSNVSETNTTYREGLYNQLLSPISANTGIYTFTFDMANLSSYGSSEIGLYGVYNPSSAPSATPTASHVPNNINLFGAPNTVLLGTIPVPPKGCNKQNYVVTFSSNTTAGFPNLGITHILITHSDNIINGKAFVGVDNFCLHTTTTTEICDNISATAVPSGNCCYELLVKNNFHDNFFTAISIETQHLNINTVSSGSHWGSINYQSPTQVVFTDTLPGNFVPKDTASFLLGNVCFTGTVNDRLIVKWIGNAPQYDTVCVDTINITHCGKPVDTNCAAILNPKIICDNGVYKMQFTVKNNSAFTMRGITLFALQTGVTPVNSFLSIPDLPPGQISQQQTTLLNVTGNDSNACFFFSACDLNVPPGTQGQYPKNCCLDSIKYCMLVPACNVCDAITITAKKENDKCCYSLSMVNNYITQPVSCMRFRGYQGSQFALLTGWSITPPVSSSDIKVCAPGTGLSSGSYPDFASFCLTGTSVSPHVVFVDILDGKGNVICTKRLVFECELVQPTCANIINDSLYCDDHKTQYSFSIKNNSTFPLYQVDLRLSDTSFKLDKYLIIPDTPILPGLTGGPYLISIDSSAEGNKTFCIYLTGHNNIYISDSVSATQCCTDSLGVVCLPFINCDSAACCTCCEFTNMIIPNGITPNHDSYNDAFVIKNSSICTSVKITVFNRWGNIVFRDDHYNNNWEGTNKNGDTLPQGTYFVVIELPSGSKRTSYIDIRY